MTHIQSMMLSVCFGSVVGYTLGSLIMIIKFAIDEGKEKKRRKVESANTQTSEK